ncbi:glycoside hydrolase family 61 protein [Immersiella caudata]|uniref:lytic cellulose monooxygenase (C4-dehydrogenating) n=1 Tax=Immersiella caudata TaxID=314043 RepID=A0AA39U613_9PEZI|nr:glycoside hydrolase family 61 protein [Immersiella caudata]
MAGILPSLLAALALFSGPVHAHGGLANYTVGDTWYRGYDPGEPESEQLGQPWLAQYQWTTIDPIFEASSPYMPCNFPGTPPPSNHTIPLSAGDTLTAIYWYWLHPVGPMSVWLAPCPNSDCATANLTTLPFFKIWEAGLLEGPNLEVGVWYQKKFQKWDGTPAEWPVVIPENLKGGRYIVRHEITSLHVPGRPQFYMQCAHLDVKRKDGEGEGVLPPARWGRLFPGAYEGDEEELMIDIYAEEYQNRTEYTVPGGPIWDG